MMNTRSAAAALGLIAGLLFIPPQLMSQARSSVSAILTVQPFPSPYASDWQKNPSIATLAITNEARTSQQVIASLIISTSAGTKIVTGNSDVITLLPGSNILNNTSVLHGNLNYYNNGLERQMAQTGRIPEGSYEACLTITDVTGSVLLQNVCASFAIVYPDPPHLVFPANGDSVNTNYPVLQLTPIQVPIQYQLHYVLKVVEVLPGQNINRAIAANVPQYTNENLLTPTLQYPINALPLKAGSTYAWQVQALDQNGFPPASNQGMSEIWTFTYKPVSGPVTPPPPPFCVAVGKVNFQTPRLCTSQLSNPIPLGFTFMAMGCGALHYSVTASPSIPGNITYSGGAVTLPGTTLPGIYTITVNATSGSCSCSGSQQIIIYPTVSIATPVVCKTGAFNTVSLDGIDAAYVQSITWQYWILGTPSGWLPLPGAGPNLAQNNNGIPENSADCSHPYTYYCTIEYRPLVQFNPPYDTNIPTCFTTSVVMERVVCPTIAPVITPIPNQCVSTGCPPIPSQYPVIIQLTLVPGTGKYNSGPHWNVTWDRDRLEHILLVLTMTNSR